MFGPRTDIVGDLDPLAIWVMPFPRRKALAEVYQRMNRIVEFETREEYLRIVYNEMWLYCGREGYACQEVVQAFLGRAVSLDESLLRAVLHQMLCRLLMRAACMPMCIRPCCCNCAAAPDDIACAKRVFRT